VVYSTDSSLNDAYFPPEVLELQPVLNGENRPVVVDEPVAGGFYGGRVS
jgi:hypothetical protein